MYHLRVVFLKVLVKSLHFKEKWIEGLSRWRCLVVMIAYLVIVRMNIFLVIVTLSWYILPKEWLGLLWRFQLQEVTSFMRKL